MKKLCLSLGLTLMLTCWCGAGYFGLGTGPAFGQDYYSPSLSCNASDPACYGDYYRAPYADPLSQLLYYVAPPVEPRLPLSAPRDRRARERDREERATDRDRQER